jgi:hypothetical protein
MNALFRSTLHGSLGLGFVSLLAYSVWAFVPRIAGSEVGMYALIALVYLLGSGLALCGLLEGTRRLKRFYALFLPAFGGYAVLWSLAWFLIRHEQREWIAALAGTLFFAWVAWMKLGKARGFRIGAIALFALHTAGYFLGGKWMYGALDHGIEGWAKPQVAIVAKLGWGLFHGLGFGAGIGFVFGWWQRNLNRCPAV